MRIAIDMIYNTRQVDFNIRRKLSCLLLFLCGMVGFSCTDGNGEITEIPIEYEDYHWEKSRTGLLEKADMALLYGGGTHRDVKWDVDHLTPYVTYTDESGAEHWLFDGFLFLEISDGNNKIFATGYYNEPATRYEWAKLVDYYFSPGTCVYALEECVAQVSERLGAPPVKPRVVIVLPEPIVAGPNSHYKGLPVDYWGSVDGERLDFTKAADRITACKWYIDYVRQRFNEGRFGHIELGGFYWMAEETLHTSAIISGVAEYLNGMNYSLDWLPFWKTGNNPDYYNWKSYGFNYTGLQPNYFFNDNVPYSRLDEACRIAKEYDLDLELEFDMDVFVDGKNRGSRLYDYMKAFRENNMLPDKRIAYYMDTDALYRLCKSTVPGNQRIYHDFNAFVLEHKKLYKREE